MKNKLTIIIILYGGMCFAFDNEFVPFDKALSSGKTILVGTIESSITTEKKPGAIKANSAVLVEKCFKGKLCQEGSKINIEYFAQTVIGTNLPVSFPVGNQVLLVLRNNIDDDSYEFDSDINNGADFAYVCNDFPYSILEMGREFVCKDAVTGKIFIDLSVDKINQIIDLDSKL